MDKEHEPASNEDLYQSRRGAKHYNAQLTDEQVRQLRVAFARRKETRETCAAIGKRFEGLSASQVHAIATGRSRPDAPGPITPAQPDWRHGDKNPRSRLGDAARVEVRRRVEAGESAVSLAREYGVTPSTVNRLRAAPVRPHATLTDADQVEIRRARARGESGVSLARRFHVSPSTISEVWARKRGKNSEGPVRNGHGHVRGEECHQTKLSESKKAEISLAYARGGVSMAALGVQYGVATNAIFQVISKDRKNGDRVKLGGRDDRPLVLGRHVPILSKKQYAIIEALIKAGRNGLSRAQLRNKSGVSAAESVLKTLCDRVAAWRWVILCPDENGCYRIAA